MTDFDPEKFEDKYVHYLPELQRAYKRAFEHMNERHDSQLVHAIDQRILNESEPFYEDASGDGGFRIELPDHPYDRLDGVVVDESRFRAVLETYCNVLERCLVAEFLEDDNDPKA